MTQPETPSPGTADQNPTEQPGRFADPRFIGESYAFYPETNEIVRAVDGAVVDRYAANVTVQEPVTEETMDELFRRRVHGELVEDNHFENMRLESTPMGENPSWAITIRRAGHFDLVYVGRRPAGLTYVTNIAGRLRQFSCVPPVGCKAGEETIFNDGPPPCYLGRTMQHGEVAIFVGDLMKESYGMSLTRLKEEASIHHLRLEFVQNGKWWEWNTSLGPEGWVKR